MTTVFELEVDCDEITLSSDEDDDDVTITEVESGKLDQCTVIDSIENFNKKLKISKDQLSLGETPNKTKSSIENFNINNSLVKPQSPTTQLGKTTNKSNPSKESGDRYVVVCADPDDDAEKATVLDSPKANVSTSDDIVQISRTEASPSASSRSSLCVVDSTMPSDGGGSDDENAGSCRANKLSSPTIDSATSADMAVSQSMPYASIADSSSNNREGGDKVSKQSKSIQTTAPSKIVQVIVDDDDDNDDDEPVVISVDSPCGSDNKDNDGSDDEDDEVVCVEDYDVCGDMKMECTSTSKTNQESMMLECNDDNDDDNGDDDDKVGSGDCGETNLVEQSDKLPPENAEPMQSNSNETESIKRDRVDSCLLEESFVIEDSEGNTVCKVDTVEKLGQDNVPDALDVSDDRCTVAMESSITTMDDNEHLLATLGAVSDAFTSYPPADSLSSFVDIDIPLDDLKVMKDDKLGMKAIVELLRIDTSTYTVVRPVTKAKVKGFQCPHCPHTVPNVPRNIEAHLDKHTSSYPWKCKLCSYSCKSLSTLILHQKCHPKQEITAKSAKIALSPLRIKLSKSQSLVVSGRMKLKNKATTASPKKKPKQEAFKAKVQKVAKGRTNYACKYCPYACSSEALAVKHEDAHKVSKGRPHVCKYRLCGFRAVTGTGLAVHERLHKKADRRKAKNVQGLVCSYCSFKPTTIGALKMHEGAHKRRMAVAKVKTKGRGMDKVPIGVNRKGESTKRTTADKITPTKTPKSLAPRHLRKEIKEKLLKQSLSYIKRETPSGGRTMYKCLKCKYTDLLHVKTTKHIIDNHFKGIFTCNSHGCWFRCDSKSSYDNHVKLCQPSEPKDDSSPLAKSKAITRAERKDADTHSRKAKARLPSKTNVAKSKTVDVMPKKKASGITSKSGKEGRPEKSLPLKKRPHRIKSPESVQSSTKKRGRPGKKTGSYDEVVPRFIEELQFASEESESYSTRTGSSGKTSTNDLRGLEVADDSSSLIPAVYDQVSRFIHDMDSSSDRSLSEPKKRRGRNRKRMGKVKDHYDDHSSLGLRIVSSESIASADCGNVNQLGSSSIEIDSAIDVPGASGLYSSYQIVEMDSSQPSFQTSPVRPQPNYLSARPITYPYQGYPQQMELSSPHGMGMGMPPGGYHSQYQGAFMPHLPPPPYPYPHIPPNPLSMATRQIDFGIGMSQGISSSMSFGQLQTNAAMSAGRWKCRFCELAFSSTVDVVRHENSHLNDQM